MEKREGRGKGWSRERWVSDEREGEKWGRKKRKQEERFGSVARGLYRGKRRLGENQKEGAKRPGTEGRETGDKGGG